MRLHGLIAAVVVLGAMFVSAAAVFTAPTTTSSLAPATAPAIASSRPSVATPAAVVVLKGEIDDYSRDAVIKRINQAKADGAKTVILVLNTPGGLVFPAQDITHFLRAQKDVHTIAFVDDMAYSAGIMIGLACDELVMKPESHVGDCAPIMLTDDHRLIPMGATERSKAESPILAEFYDSSIRNGYDPLLTSSMVKLDVVVHYIQSPTGQKKFVDDKGYDELTAKGWKPVEGVPDPLDKADTLLTVGSDLAAKIGLSKGTFDSPEEFATARNLQIRQTFEPSAGETAISWLGSAWMRGILIVVLLQAIYLAFSHPGHGWPEAIAATALVLLVGVPLLTGYATWWEAVAILAGLVLLAVEIFVLPGHLLPGLIGVALLLGGLVMTFVGIEPSGTGFSLPSLQGTWINLERGLITVTAGLGCSLGLWIWLNRYLPKLPYFNKLILKTTDGQLAAMDSPVETGPAVGDIGVAVSELKPGGSVKFITESYPDGRIAAVISDSGFVTPGTTVVKVREVAGNRVVVRRQA